MRLCNLLISLNFGDFSAITLHFQCISYHLSRQKSHSSATSSNSYHRVTQIEALFNCYSFKIFVGLAPSYLSFLITSKPVSKYNLRSSSDGTLLSFPNIKPEATLGERAFVFAALKL